MANLQVMDDAIPRGTCQGRSNVNLSELVAELQQAPGPDLENKLGSLIERLQQEGMSDTDVHDLRMQINELKATNDRLEQTVNELRDYVARVMPEPINQTYTMDQFMLALCVKLGRTYGWRTDYARATANTPGSHHVTTDDIQRWQKQRHVPDWAFTQIEVLDYRARLGRSGPTWKPDEVNHLIQLYVADPHEPNASLARKCSEHFNRPITEQAIKGAVYRLGRQGRLPAQRPR